MKKAILLLIAGGTTLSATAQTTAPGYTKDRDLGRWVIDVNFMGGAYTQHTDFANTSANYLNGVNINTGTTGTKNGSAFGGNLQLGLFVGKARHWGIGTGLLYLRESSDVSLSNFHAEYQSVDNNGFIFRQVVSANNFTEHIKTDNYNIPLLLKYKNRFSKHWGFTADAGALFNIKVKNSYSTNAAFDYEAIYKFSPAGSTNAVYENAAIPADNDFLITRDQYTKNNPGGNVTDYFNQKKAEGYNVGLGVTPNAKGTSSYAKGSVGFLVQPSINYFFSDHVALNVGAYYLYQPFKNDGTAGYTLTGKPGDYSSVMNSATKVNTQSFGGVIGLRFFLGKKSKPMNMTATAMNQPTSCGLCDGKIVLNGLESGKQAFVSYKLNSADAVTNYNGTVGPDGTVQVVGLCAGTYSDIQAKIGGRSAATAPVTLTDPPLAVTAVSTAPTAKGACDATITLYGISAGQKATVTYALNGVAQRAYVTTVSADNSIKLSRLCEGTYTDITVSNGKCSGTASPATFTLNAPVQEPVAATPTSENVEDLPTILFDFNTSNIKPVSYGLIDEAYKALNEDRQLTLLIDGNTDAIGSDDYNQALSERRALAVKKYLTDKGIDGSRITYHANGERKPIATNETSDGRKKNRRANMILSIKN